MTSFGGFETCEFEEFTSEATPQSSTLEEAASTMEILIQQIEGYLQRFRAAVCTDLTTVESQIPVPLDEFTELIDTPGTYVGAGLFSVRVNVLETGLEFAPFPIVQGADHGLLAGLADDDHLQYLLLAGRAGGQQAFGGTAASEELQMRGSTDANLGIIRMQSPVQFDAYTISGEPYAFEYAATETPPGAFVGGGLNMSGVITTANALFIYESFRGAPNITTGVAPGFAAYTVLQAIPVLNAGVGTNPLNCQVLNAAPSTRNAFAGVRTSPTVGGVNFAPTVVGAAAGATMNVTAMTGMVVAPKWNTVLGSVISFGTVRGLHIQAPAQALFASSAGVENIGAYFGVDIAANTFGGASRVVHGIRSALAAALNVRFLNNIGTAESEFGAGHIHFGDQAGVKYGATLATADVFNFWDIGQAAMAWSTFFGIGGNPLYLRPAATDTWTFQQNNGGLQDIGLGFNANAISFGVIDPVPNSNNWFVIFAAPNLRQVQIGGEYSDVLWTASGSIDVNGQVVSDLQAFKINSPAVVLNGGTIADLSNLFVDAMPSFGATRHQAFRVLGRTRGDGLQCHNEATLAQLTASVVQLTLPANNLGRFVLLEDADASGPWTIRGILNVQVGDMFHMVNTGANAFLLGHQDGAAAAIDRIISPTGVALTLGPDESALLWYDPVATRWRILETTGA
jgi:hypothetical protein